MKDQTSGLLLILCHPQALEIDCHNAIISFFLFPGNNSVRSHLVIVSHDRRFSLVSIEYIKYCLSFARINILKTLNFRSGGVFCCISFELSCSYYSLRRSEGGSTGVVRDPRHRPLTLVAYRTASTRKFPPPADWSGL